MYVTLHICAFAAIVTRGREQADSQPLYQLEFLRADGGHDVHKHLGLSGEPLIPDLEAMFQPRPPLGLLQYQDLTVEGLKYEAAYSDYWNSTVQGDDG